MMGPLAGQLGPLGWSRRSAQVPHAISFSATSSQYLSATVSLGLASSLGLSFWIKPNTLNSGDYQSIVSYDGILGFLFQRAGDTNVLRLAWNGALDFFNGPQFTTTGTWSHLVVSAQDTSVNFYVNNVKTTGTRGSGTSGFFATDPRPFELGRRTETANQYTDGALDAVALYSRSLNDADVSALYNSGAGLGAAGMTGSLATGLLAYYGFQDATNLGLDSMNHFTLTNMNGATQVPGLVV